MSASIEAAYTPFIASLRAASFTVPDEGWPAELIGAHVAMNNDLIAALAESVAAGEEPSYDNEVGVDDEALRSFVEASGGLAGVADAVERSAVRLAAAYDALGERSGTLVPVVIRDGGSIVADRPMAVGAFCEGNASFHLDLHRRQLDALEIVPTGEAPEGFDRYELVLLVRRSDTPQLSEEETAAVMRLHLGFFAKMQAAGYLLTPGPLRGEEGEPLAGLSLYRTGSVEKTRRLAEDDPAVRAGWFSVRVLEWYTAAGALSFGA